MKTICLIRDDSPFWREVGSYLKNAGAEVRVHDEARGAPDADCDLVIGGEGILRLALPRGIPKMTVTTDKSVRAWAKDVHFVAWPISEERFLEMTSRLLHLSERRRFKAVITVRLKGDSEPYMGRSEDFSLTGLAFRVDKELRKGNIVTVSFHVPDIDQRVSVEAEVMRAGSDPFDGSLYYGARFVGLSEEDKWVLEKFIAKGR